MKHSLVPCFVVVMLVGCGGSDDGSTPGGTGTTCTQTSPCGGDVAGDWSIVSFCPDKSNAAPQEVKDICADATVEFENRPYPDRGAVIRVRWPRDTFERPPERSLERPLGLAAT